MKIISLTSIPSRFHYLYNTLESLVQQKCADEIRLYIPQQYKRFPEWNRELPKIPNGVKIARTEIDLGPATKVLPCAMEFQGKNVQILFCDDDCTHPKNWAKNLFKLQSQRPNEAVATFGRLVDAELPESRTQSNKPIAISQNLNKNLKYRFDRLLQKTLGIQAYNRPIKKAGYVDLLFGVGGVVIRPEFFDKSSIIIPEEAFFVDDIWLSAQLAKNNVPIFCPKRYPMPIPSEASDIEALFDYSINGNRFQQNKRAAMWCRNNLSIWQ